VYNVANKLDLHYCLLLKIL